MAANIKAARRAAALTQSALATAIGVESTAISRWERGAHGPTDGNLVALAHVLQRDVSWFYEDPEARRIPSLFDGASA